jgi:hypothetical protein
MARPKSWFERKEYTTAKKVAKTRSQTLWMFTRSTQDGSKETGYYVGNNIPARLKTADLQRKSI